MKMKTDLSILLIALRQYKTIEEILIKDIDNNFRIVTGSFEIIADESCYHFEGYGFNVPFKDIKSYYFLNWWEEIE